MNLRRGLVGDDLIQEIEDKMQGREMRHFPSMPDIKQVLNKEVISVNDSGTNKLVIRIGNKLYSASLTEV